MDHRLLALLQKARQENFELVLESNNEEFLGDFFVTFRKTDVTKDDHDHPARGMFWEDVERTRGEWLFRQMVEAVAEGLGEDQKTWGFATPPPLETPKKKTRGEMFREAWGLFLEASQPTLALLGALLFTIFLIGWMTGGWGILLATTFE